MKESLYQHLQDIKSLEAKPPVRGKDLQDPEIYKSFVEDRKKLHQPIPPGNLVRFSDHHWLVHRPEILGTGGGELVVSQWSPTELV